MDGNNLTESANAREHIGFPMTLTQIETYWEYLSDKGLQESTIRTYRRNLLWFYQELPPDKWVTRSTLAQWSASLLERGYTTRTVNAVLTAVNGFFEFLDLREYQLANRLKLPAEHSPLSLSRWEYLSLLSAARHLGRQREYLLVKVFACTGLTVEKLPCLTAEAVAQGQIHGAEQEPIAIPVYLQEELLDFLQAEALSHGPIFVSRTGKPLHRTAVTTAIHNLAQTAQIDPAKCNPRCLRRLYQVTQEKIQADLARLAAQSYARLLAEEQRAIGWQSGKGLPVKRRRSAAGSGTQGTE